jgi:ankyrin repeat protein
LSFLGNSEIVRILLEAGAKTHQTNSIGRTAAQLAAFTGQKLCVDTINNYVTLDDLKYYSIPQGQFLYYFFCFNKQQEIKLFA